MQPEVHLLVQHQVHLLVHLCIYKYWSSPSGATPGVLSGAPEIVSSSAAKTHLLFFRLHSHSYFQFLIGQISHPFAPLSPFLRAFSTSFRIHSHYIFWGSYLWLCCVVPSSLLTTLSKIFTPMHVSFIMLELHYMLTLSKGQLHFEIIQVSYALR